MSDKQQIHEAVQARYGAIARAIDIPMAAISCCDTSQQAAADCGCGPKLYDDALLDQLPVDVTGLSLGCGDPVTIADLKAGETVLDLGSGGGIDCFLAARQVGETGHVIGVDMTPAMLAKANASRTKMGVTNVEFREGKIEALPVEDNTIDVVMSNCVINLSPDKPAVFREIFRVLKPGGRASISDIVTEGSFRPEQQEDLAQWSECITGAIDVDDYTAMIRDAGFVDVQIVDKQNAEPALGHTTNQLRIFSARITGRKA